MARRFLARTGTLARRDLSGPRRACPVTDWKSPRCQSVTIGGSISVTIAILHRQKGNTCVPLACISRLSRRRRGGGGARPSLVRRSAAAASCHRKFGKTLCQFISGTWLSYISGGNHGFRKTPCKSRQKSCLNSPKKSHM